MKLGAFQRNQFGGTLGGPVWVPGVYNGKNRTFFFFSEQSTRTRSASSATATVPVADWLNGDFSNLKNGAGQLITIYDPLSVSQNGSQFVRAAFPGNIIPKDRMDPVALKVMQYYPKPNAVPNNAVHVPEQLLPDRQVAERRRQVRQPHRPELLVEVPRVRARIVRLQLQHAVQRLPDDRDFLGERTEFDRELQHHGERDLHVQPDDDSEHQLRIRPVRQPVGRIFARHRPGIAGLPESGERRGGDHQLRVPALRLQRQHESLLARAGDLHDAAIPPVVAYPARRSDQGAFQAHDQIRRRIPQAVHELHAARAAGRAVQLQRRQYAADRRAARHPPLKATASRRTSSGCRPAAPFNIHSRSPRRALTGGSISRTTTK